MNLTCNQLMVLLAIYRGSLDAEHKPGTHEQDLAHLKSEGFIKLVNGSGSRLARYDCTTLADRWVREELLKGKA